MISRLTPAMVRHFGALTSLAISALAGCGPTATVTGPPPGPEVVATWAMPEERQFTPFEEFTGHVEALESVQVRARVSGYLDKILFEDGAEVQEGQELFQLDKDIFEAEKSKAAGTLAQAESRLARASAQFERAQILEKNNSITTDEFERIESDKKEAEAAVTVAKATLKLAELDCDFTTVKAPLDGRISRRTVDKGNLIKADDTLLATIVKVDEIYAVFEIDERAAIRLKKFSLENSRFARPLADLKIEVELFLIDQARDPLRGKIDFSDNELDPHTGTLRVRARVPNRNLMLSPGFFVRCRMPMEDPDKPQRRLCVPEEALGSDQGQRFLYVYNSEGKVEDRRVKIGPLLDGWRVIEENLAPDDRVIVSGLQRVRPGENKKVTFKEEQKYAAAKVKPESKAPLSHQAAQATPKTAGD